MTSSVLEGYGKIKSVVLDRLDTFSNIKDKEEIFYELCFCLLTPQSNAKRCASAVEELKSLDLFNAPVSPEKVRDVLKTKTRFHNNKTRYVCDLKKLFDVLCEEFDLSSKSEDPVEVRNWLVDNVNGLGLKEASHFLRNVGFRGLAILDRHILRNLTKLGVIDEVSKGLTRKEYLLIEEKFKTYCMGFNISMDEIDLYFWYSETGEVFK